MILKGSARGGALDLALHVSNALENEAVTIAEMRGMVADDLYEGFQEWALIAAQTNAEKAFYSLSINPDPTQRDLSEADWKNAIRVIEERLGLTDQPHAVIFHEKTGEDGNLRKHCHVVWSRIRRDGDQLKAIHLGHDYYKLKSAALEIAKDLKLDLPPGLTTPEKKSETNFDHAKSHGKNRDVETLRQRKETLSRLWVEHDTSEAFCEAAEADGYIVARGERRAFVVVDRSGEIHSLPRQIHGVKTKEVKERLGDASTYPSVEGAKAKQKALLYAEEKETAKRSDLSREQRLYQKLRRFARRADGLMQQRQRQIQKLTRDLHERHESEQKEQTRKQRAKTVRELKSRYQKKPKGFLKTVCDKIGVSKILNWLDSQEDKKRELRFADERNRQSVYHDLDQKRLERKAQRFEQQRKREARSIRKLAAQLHIKKDPLALVAELKGLQKSETRAMRLT